MRGWVNVMKYLYKRRRFSFKVKVNYFSLLRARAAHLAVRPKLLLSADALLPISMLIAPFLCTPREVESHQKKYSHSKRTFNIYFVNVPSQRADSIPE
jgi:hypothetical protein